MVDDTPLIEGLEEFMANPKFKKLIPPKSTPPAVPPAAAPPVVPTPTKPLQTKVLPEKLEAGGSHPPPETPGLSPTRNYLPDVDPNEKGKMIGDWVENPPPEYTPKTLLPQPAQDYIANGYLSANAQIRNIGLESLTAFNSRMIESLVFESKLLSSNRIVHRGIPEVLDYDVGQEFTLSTPTFTSLSRAHAFAFSRAGRLDVDSDEPFNTVISIKVDTNTRAVVTNLYELEHILMIGQRMRVREAHRDLKVKMEGKDFDVKRYYVLEAIGDPPETSTRPVKRVATAPEESDIDINRVNKELEELKAGSLLGDPDEAVSPELTFAQLLAEEEAKAPQMREVRTRNMSFKADPRNEVKARFESWTDDFHSRTEDAWVENPPIGYKGEYDVTPGTRRYTSVDYEEFSSAIRHRISTGKWRRPEDERLVTTILAGIENDRVSLDSDELMFRGIRKALEHEVGKPVVWKKPTSSSGSGYMSTQFGVQTVYEIHTKQGQRVVITNAPEQEYIHQMGTKLMVRAKYEDVRFLILEDDDDIEAVGSGEVLHEVAAKYYYVVDLVEQDVDVPGLSELIKGDITAYAHRKPALTDHFHRTETATMARQWIDDPPAEYKPIQDVSEGTFQFTTTDGNRRFNDILQRIHNGEQVSKEDSLFVESVMSSVSSDSLSIAKATTLYRGIPEVLEYDPGELIEFTSPTAASASGFSALRFGALDTRHFVGGENEIGTVFEIVTPEGTSAVVTNRRMLEYILTQGQGFKVLQRIDNLVMKDMVVDDDFNTADFRIGRFYLVEMEPTLRPETRINRELVDIVEKYDNQIDTPATFKASTKDFTARNYRALRDSWLTDEAGMVPQGYIKTDLLLPGTQRFVRQGMDDLDPIRDARESAQIFDDIKANAVTPRSDAKVYMGLKSLDDHDVGDTIEFTRPVSTSESAHVAAVDSLVDDVAQTVYEIRLRDSSQKVVITNPNHLEYILATSGVKYRVAARYDNARTDYGPIFRAGEDEALVMRRYYVLEPTEAVPSVRSGPIPGSDPEIPQSSPLSTGNDYKPFTEDFVKERLDAWYGGKGPDWVDEDDLRPGTADYTGGEYDEVNRLLREAAGDPNAEIPDFVQRILGDINADAKPTIGPITVYRGVNADIDVDVGQEFDLLAPTSTSESALLASKYAKGKTFLEIKVPTGTQTVVTNPSELEHIIAPNYSVKVLAKHENVKIPGSKITQSALPDNFDIDLDRYYVVELTEKFAASQRIKKEPGGGGAGGSVPGGLGFAPSAEFIRRRRKDPNEIDWEAFAKAMKESVKLDEDIIDTFGGMDKYLERINREWSKSHLQDVMEKVAQKVIKVHEKYPLIQAIYGQALAAYADPGVSSVVSVLGLEPSTAAAIGALTLMLRYRNLALRYGDVATTTGAAALLGGGVDGERPILSEDQYDALRQEINNFLRELIDDLEDDSPDGDGIDILIDELYDQIVHHDSDLAPSSLRSLVEELRS